jgi:CubicO group peptidase (beta-lactamase class C family)
MRITRRQFTALALAAGARPSFGADAAQVDETLRSGIARRKIPAAVGMFATADKTLYSGAFGTRDSSGVAVTPDSIFSIASMTKAVTTVAALQLVEQGKVALDEPVSKHLPQLAKLDVLDGFDKDSGKPRLRPAKTPVTLKHLLTHTSGFCYDTWDGDMFRYASQSASGAAQPLMFEPGTRWQYGQGCDWAGRLVETVSGMTLEEYFQKRILGPLAMQDTSYILPPAKFERLVTRYERQSGDSLQQAKRAQPNPPKEFNGGGGLYSTTGDYVRFMQMILGKGTGVNRAQVLHPKTVAAMEVNQIGTAGAGKMKSCRPATSSDVDMQPGVTEKWGLGFLINTTPYERGRAAGSLAWAGLYNTYYWIDPNRGRCGVLMMAFLPFADREALGLLGDFERSVYRAFA